MYYYEGANSLVRKVRDWFESNRVETELRAIIGFSGGVDSAVTAALCSEAGIPVTLVLANAPGQKRSSNFCPHKFAALYKNMDVRVVDFGINLDTNAGKEAALPILRNAYFYGVAAEARANGEFAIVVGTANFDEAAYLGFWGKASDGAQDLYPISHLHKANVKNLGHELRVPLEIIGANPSGDLLYSGECDDLSMIGAGYPRIEQIARLAMEYDASAIADSIALAPNPKRFVNNVINNSFKYKLPFPGVHISDKLEEFRNKNYILVHAGIRQYEKRYA